MSCSSVPRKDFFFPPGVSSCFTSHTGLRSITRREQSVRTNSVTQFRHCCSKQETALGNPDSECEVWNESLLITQRVPPCLPCKTRIKTTSTLLWCLESLRGRCLKHKNSWLCSLAAFLKQESFLLLTFYQTPKHHVFMFH